MGRLCFKSWEWFQDTCLGKAVPARTGLDSSEYLLGTETVSKIVVPSATYRFTLIYRYLLCCVLLMCVNSILFHNEDLSYTLLPLYYEGGRTTNTDMRFHSPLINPWKYTSLMSMLPSVAVICV